MRVAIDARTLQVRPPGGIGRSLANVLPLLAPHLEIHLLTDAGGGPVDLRLPQHALRTPLPSVSATWLQGSAPWWLRRFGGIFHCPFYGLPNWLPVPGVVTLHDLTFEHFPDWYPRRQTIAFRVQARRAARTAKAILTVSEFVKADIVETYRVDPDRIVVAPHGIDPAFRPDLEVGPLLHRLGVAPRYVIALGGAPRRNTGVAIEAWRQVRSAGLDVDLVVVGGPAPAREAGLVHTVAPPDEEWAALLSGAEVFVYPTTYEGFGMPALEALGAGTPVVAARVGSLPEVLGHTASWCESTRAHDVATALAEVLLDDAMRQRLRSDGFERAAAAPGWPVAAAAHLEAYQRAAS